jgi:hypothetical protein
MGARDVAMVLAQSNGSYNHVIGFTIEEMRYGA